MTPTVTPERGLNLVNPLMPAKSKRNPEARICMPKRAWPCDSVPSGPVPGRVFARPFGNPIEPAQREFHQRFRGFHTLGEIQIA